MRGNKPFGFNAVSGGFYGTTFDEEAFLYEQVGASMARLGVDWAMVQYYPNHDDVSAVHANFDLEAEVLERLTAA